MTAIGATQSSGHVSANDGSAHRFPPFHTIPCGVSVAPIPDARLTTIGRLKSTFLGPLG